MWSEGEVMGSSRMCAIAINGKWLSTPPGPLYPQDSNFNLGRRKQLCLVTNDDFFCCFFLDRKVVMLAIVRYLNIVVVGFTVEERAFGAEGGLGGC